VIDETITVSMILGAILFIAGFVMLLHSFMYLCGGWSRDCGLCPKILQQIFGVLGIIIGLILVFV
jgi:hypothetical protein